jgi:hypothetical protein
MVRNPTAPGRSIYDDAAAWGDDGAAEPEPEPERRRAMVDAFGDPFDDDD